MYVFDRKYLSGQTKFILDILLNFLLLIFKITKFFMFPVGPRPGTHFNYYGCYVDKPRRKLTGYYYSYHLMSPKICVETCRVKNFLYAGVQNG